MTHPTPAELLELHFGEATAERAARTAAHVRACDGCRALLRDVAGIEQALFAGLVGGPPADGLERVLQGVDARHPARAQPRAGLRAAVPSLAAIAAGAVAATLFGATAALAFFAAGSLVTLSLAPALILESRRQGQEAAAR